MGIGFPHDPPIAGCGLGTKKGSGEWGVANGVYKVISQLPTPHPHLPSSSAIIAKPGEFSLDSVAA